MILLVDDLVFHTITRAQLTSHNLLLNIPHRDHRDSARSETMWLTKRSWRKEKRCREVGRRGRKQISVGALSPWLQLRQTFLDLVSLQTFLAERVGDFLTQRALRILMSHRLLFSLLCVCVCVEAGLTFPLQHLHFIRPCCWAAPVSLPCVMPLAANAAVIWHTQTPRRVVTQYFKPDAPANKSCRPIKQRDMPPDLELCLPPGKTRSSKHGRKTRE